MPQFAYKAMQRDGAMTEGFLDASNRQEALRQVEGRGLRPIKLAESGTAGPPKKPAAARGAEKRSAEKTAAGDKPAAPVFPALSFGKRKITPKMLENFTRLLSSLLANTPVVAASILMIKGYLVAAEIVPEVAMSPQFDDWPAATLPVFVAMMYGATLGGNATLIGSAANVVAAGVCARNGEPISFVRWLRYGVPLTLCQLAVAAVYVLALARLGG